MFISFFMFNTLLFKLTYILIHAYLQQIENTSMYLRIFQEVKVYNYSNLVCKLSLNILACVQDLESNHPDVYQQDRIVKILLTKCRKYKRRHMWNIS